MFNGTGMILVGGFILAFGTAIYMAVDYRDTVIQLRDEVTALKSKIEECETAAKRVNASCMINDRVISDLSETKSVMVGKSADILIKVSKLTSLAEVTDEPNKTTNSAITAADIELGKLLDEAYCTAAKSDPYCSTR